jgi:hypothetical protein
MSSSDPFPGIEFTEAVDKLKRRFPNADVKAEPIRGGVFMNLPLSGGRSLAAALTWQQAKYLAYKKVKFDDIAAGNFPDDWPT